MTSELTEEDLARILLATKSAITLQYDKIHMGLLDSGLSLREQLQPLCKHGKTTVVIDSDENGIKTQKTICDVCGKILTDDETISNIKI